MQVAEFELQTLNYGDTTYYILQPQLIRVKLLIPAGRVFTPLSRVSTQADIDQLNYYLKSGIKNGQLDNLLQQMVGP